MQLFGCFRFSLVFESLIEHAFLFFSVLFDSLAVGSIFLNIFIHELTLDATFLHALNNGLFFFDQFLLLSQWDVSVDFGLDSDEIESLLLDVFLI